MANPECSDFDYHGDLDSTLTENNPLRQGHYQRLQAKLCLLFREEHRLTR